MIVIVKSNGQYVNKDDDNDHGNSDVVIVIIRVSAYERGVQQVHCSRARKLQRAHN